MDNEIYLMWAGLVIAALLLVLVGNIRGGMCARARISELLFEHSDLLNAHGVAKKEIQALIGENSSTWASIKALDKNANRLLEEVEQLNKLHNGGKYRADDGTYVTKEAYYSEIGVNPGFVRRTKAKI